MVLRNNCQNKHNGTTDAQGYPAYAFEKKALYIAKDNLSLDFIESTGSKLPTEKRICLCMV